MLRPARPLVLAAAFSLLSFTMIALVGCGGTAGTQGGTSAGSSGDSGSDSANTGKFLYFVQGPGDYQPLAVYDSSLSSTSTPIGTLTLPAGYSANEVVSAPDGTLYVLAWGEGQSEIFVYAPESMDPATPERTLDMAPFEPDMISADSSGFVYALQTGNNNVSPSQINVYPPTASGSALPLRKITDSNIDEATGLAVANGYVFLSGYTAGTAVATSAIDVFANDSDSGSPPARTILPSHGVLAIAVDSNGDIFANGFVGSADTPVVDEYPAGASGASAPSHTLYLDGQLFNQLGSIVLDQNGNLFTAGIGASITPPATPPTSVLSLGPSATFGSGTPSTFTAPIPLRFYFTAD